jgi:3-hydroxyisobutyrate dehydrogenase-like beta-hydroxyacid dehydrogenase
MDKVLLAGESLRGKVFVDTSTIHPDTSELVARRLGDRGADFIAAPVFGASPVAAAGNLIFAIAGPTRAVEKISPLVLNVMGKSIIHMGQEVQKSSLLKISG